MIIRKDVQIAAQGAPIEVEIQCGFAHHISFQAKLFDTAGNNPVKIHEGSNIETDPPPFAINVTPPELIDRFLKISADVDNLGTINRFHVEVIFRQDGNEVGRIVADDEFTDTITLSIVTRFQG